MNVLITVPWDKEQLDLIRGSFPQLIFRTALAEEEILAAIADTEVVFGDISRAEFLRAEKLRWIQCHGAGVNKLVSIPELVASDVVITNTSGAHAATIAEHFFGGLLCLTRRLPELYLAQTRREWVNWPDWPEKVGRGPVGLKGLTIGIIGFGNIGRAIAERATGFQMHVVAADIFDLQHPSYLEKMYPIDELGKMLEKSDVVVVTAPGTPQTNNLLDRQTLGRMKNGAYLGVVSRGGIVDEEAVADMLLTGKLGGAVMDVFKQEPLLSTSHLWDAPNLLLTPHCSGKSEQTTEAATCLFMNNLHNYLSGAPLINVVRKELGF